MKLLEKLLMLFSFVSIIPAYSMNGDKPGNRHPINPVQAARATQVLKRLIYSVDLDADYVKRLILQGGNPNTANHYNYYPLSWFATEHQPDMVRFLLDHGANPNTQGRSGTTALLSAINLSMGKPGDAQRKAEVVELLLNRHANPNIKGQYGSSPLLSAMWCNSPIIVKLLLDHGANPLDGINEWTAIQVAHDSQDLSEENRLIILKLLREASQKQKLP